MNEDRKQRTLNSYSFKEKLLAIMKLQALPNDIVIKFFEAKGKLVKNKAGKLVIEKKKIVNF